MYLTISPKEALKQIDLLVKEGYELQNAISDDYQAQEENLEKSAILEEKKEEEELKNLKAQVSSSESAIDQVEALNKLTLLQLKPPSLNIGYDKEQVSQKIIDSYFQRYSEWNGRVIVSLKEIFSHFAPVYKFETSVELTKFESFPFGNGVYREFRHILDRFDSNLSVLVSFYDDFKSLIKSPLIYLPDKAQILFYDFSCQLTPDSNEDALCKFMFDHNVGEWIHFADIYEYIKGELPSGKGWEKTIGSAYDGINRKTNDFLGFPVLTKQKKMLAIKFSSRLVSAF